MTSPIGSVLTILIFSWSPLLSQNYNVYFDFNSTVLRVNDVGKLRSLLNEFSHENQRIYLVGHTDTVGNHEFNMNLSRKRTAVVKEFLVSGGISASQIKTDYKGENAPVSSDQYYNRRVELSLIDQQPDYTSFTAFKESLKPEPQIFRIPSDESLEIEGNRGTIMSIPANAFISSTGEIISGEIEIKLIEFYTIGDFFSDGLSTLSNSALLSSAGMVYIKATQENNDLQLRPNKELDLLFPKTNELNYSTFYGERTITGNMNWIQATDNKPNQRDFTLDQLGVTFSLDGESLVLIEKSEAEERNQKLRFNPLNRTFGLVSEQEIQEIEEYYADELNEQKKIDRSRERYYNILKSRRLGYINCDIEIQNTTPVDFTVEVTNPDITIVSACLIFRNTNSLITFSDISKASAHLHARLPLGELPELLVIGVNGDAPFKWHKQQGLKSVVKEPVLLTRSSYKEIKRIL